jgi:uncharacterized protein (TIGR03118 family)
MERHSLGRRLRGLATAFAVLAAAATVLASSASGAGNSYTVTKLVADQTGKAASVDPSLVNAWGLASLPGSPWWVADNGTDVSTLYRADGSKVPLTVSVRSAPTGAVSNTGSSFVVRNGTQSGPALFLFATEDGKIRGWAGTTVSGTEAQIAVNRTADGDVYKGIALASTSDGDFIYVTDFHHARVDVFNGSFARVIRPGAFTDPEIPAGYAPFGIQNVGGSIVVTYAQQDAAAHDDVPGLGHGFVDMYDTSGHLLRHIAMRGLLNSPWGIAQAPSDFGAFSGDLLIGNFGDGRITALVPTSSGPFTVAGQLRTGGDTLAIDGLWSLQFGKGTTNNGPTNTLFFTAGPDHESHGLLGTITATG